MSIVLLLLAAVVSAGAVLKVPRTYQAQATVVLLASKSTAKPEGGNPYLSFTPSLTLTADVVSRVMMGPAVVSSLATQGYSAPYSVTLAPNTTTTTGSVLLVTVTGTHKASVEITLHGVTSEIGRELALLQQQVSRRSQISSVTLASSAHATVSITKTARLLIMIIAPAWLVALLIPFVAERLSARRPLPEAIPRRERVPHPADAFLTGARGRGNGLLG